MVRGRVGVRVGVGGRGRVRARGRGSASVCMLCTSRLNSLRAMRTMFECACSEASS